jgi:hypothetical protein
MKSDLTVNPWTAIWLHPRETIRAIINFNPKFRFILLSIIYGLPMAFNTAQNYSLSEAIPLWAIVGGAILLCGFLGALAITIGSALLTWTGKWIGGKGSFDKVRCAVAWSSGVPSCVIVVTWAVLIATFGPQAFSRMFAETPFVGYQAGIVFLVFLIESIVWVWSLIMLFKTLGEVHGFSAWKAVLNVIIAFAIVFALVWFLGWIFWGQTQVVVVK